MSPMKRLLLLLALLLVVAVAVAVGLHALAPRAEVASTPPTALPASAVPQAVPPTASPGSQPVVVPSPSPSPSPAPADPFALISQAGLFATLEDLTAIRPFSGWRNSASRGEAEALDYVAARLGEFRYLAELGLDLERQSFRVFMGTELWETRLEITVDGRTLEVPADGLRGPRDETDQVANFDSDGVLNDAERDPVVVEGPVAVIRTAADLDRPEHAVLVGRVVLVDYAALDRITSGGSQGATGLASVLLDRDPAGLVLVTSFSNKPGQSHGAFVGDSSVLNGMEPGALPPTLYVRREDLEAAGVLGWKNLERIESARLTWDADFSSPAASGNLVAHLPGVDPSRAIILSAHIDSPNGPGAMDDGSGSAILVEVARVLDAARVQPPIDLYLVWYGSEELGLYGSAHFVATHQELLDRTVAMLQIDCLTRPLDGIDADLTLVTWGYGQFGAPQLPWPDHLAAAAARRGVTLVSQEMPAVYSDNSSFAGYDVPQADLIYINEAAMEAAGSLHYAAHIHDPYDTVELAREVGDVFEQMARVALSAALEQASDLRALRVAPPPDRRALFVASHTEPPQMTPAGFIGLGMALAWEGFDLDLVPYGQPLTAADLDGTDLVVALPAIDYPPDGAGPGLYDEAWSAQEVALLEAYVADGGLLVLTNSAHRLKYGSSKLEPNEDWAEANALAARFGVTYEEGDLEGRQAEAEPGTPLMEGVEALSLAGGNAVPFGLVEGQVLARAGSAPVAAWIEVGPGGVLVLADVSLLNVAGTETGNLRFWQNLAAAARRSSPDSE